MIKILIIYFIIEFLVIFFIARRVIRVYKEEREKEERKNKK